VRDKPAVVLWGGDKISNLTIASKRERHDWGKKTEIKRFFLELNTVTALK
jgi:hypothetical protein